MLRHQWRYNMGTTITMINCLCFWCLRNVLSITADIKDVKESRVSSLGTVRSLHCKTLLWMNEQILTHSIGLLFIDGTQHKTFHITWMQLISYNTYIQLLTKSKPLAPERSDVSRPLLSALISAATGQASISHFVFYHSAPESLTRARFWL